MKLRFNSLAIMLAAASLLSAPAFAQSAGQWTVKVGATKITPKVESEDVTAPALPGTKSDVSANTQPTFAISYSWTDNIVFQLDLGLPYKHKIYGAGSIQGVGQLATVKALPPTAFVQYRFLEANSKLRPYVGLGATYAYFADETGSGQLTAVSDIGGPPTTFSIKNKLAATGAVGLLYNINERYFADVFVSKTWLKTKVAFSSGQTQQMTLNPQAVGISIGYKF
jgi:outer membrane protein